MIPVEGSRIKVEINNEGKVFSWFDYKGGLSDILIPLFLLVWLAAWVVGESVVIYGLFSPLEEPGIKFFLAGWLGMWTVGGIGATWTLLKLLRRSKPTRLIFLMDGRLKFEQGSYEKRFIDGEGRQVSSVVKKGKRYGIFEKSKIGNIMLERIGGRQRLSFDYKSQRIEIGKGLTESEKELLFAELKQYRGE
jgi:hypothetical protein